MAGKAIKKGVVLLAGLLFMWAMPAKGSDIEKASENLMKGVRGLELNMKGVEKVNQLVERGGRGTRGALRGVSETEEKPEKALFYAGGVVTLISTYYLLWEKTHDAEVKSKLLSQFKDLIVTLVNIDLSEEVIEKVKRIKKNFSETGIIGEEDFSELTRSIYNAAAQKYGEEVSSYYLCGQAIFLMLIATKSGDYKFPEEAVNTIDGLYKMFLLQEETPEVKIIRASLKNIRNIIKKNVLTEKDKADLEKEVNTIINTMS
jgi:hypothetical protein